MGYPNLIGQINWSPLSTTLLALVLVLVAVVAYLIGQWRKEAAKKARPGAMRVTPDRSEQIIEDIRTPLTVIAAAADQLQEQGTHPTEPLQLIRSNSQYLLQLIARQQDQARLAGGALHLDMEQEDILPHLQQLVESLRFLAEEQRVHLSWQTDMTKCLMDFDRVRLVHILSALLTLAIGQSGAGQRVWITARRADHEPVLYLQVHSSDDHVQDLWQKATLQATCQQEGLDYDFLQHLVGLMDGQLELVHTPPVLSLRLPITRQAPVKTVPSRAAAESAVANMLEHEDAPLILIVEDNPDLVSLLTQILNLDYNLLVARNGQEGIDLAIQQVPDVVITDVMMPQKDGYELSYTLKNHILTSHIPIIMMSARTGMRSRMTGMRQGADAYLEKPFQPEELETLVQALLEQRNRLHAYYLSISGLSEEAVARPKSALPDQQEDQFLRKLTDLITEHLEDEDLSVEHLSQMLYMDPSNLYRKVKALTGWSPVQYIQTLRVQRARNLLRDPEKSISEVALACGFNSSGYFARVFKKETGMTPSAYRKQLP